VTKGRGWGRKEGRADAEVAHTCKSTVCVVIFLVCVECHEGKRLGKEGGKGRRRGGAYM